LAIFAIVDSDVARWEVVVSIVDERGESLRREGGKAKVRSRVVRATRKVWRPWLAGGRAQIRNLPKNRPVWTNWWISICSQV